MRTPHRSPLALAIALAVAASACTGGAEEPAASDARLKVAFFQDLSIEDPLDLVSPSFLALEAGLAQAADGGTRGVPIIVQFDTGGDPVAALESAQTVAADDAYVAVVAAPFWTMPEDVAAVFADAGLPVLSLSDASRPAAPGLVWRRFVAPAPAQADELAARAGAATRGTICVVSDDTIRAEALAPAVGERLGDRAVARTAADVDGCGAVVWTGGPSGAAALRVSLPDERPLLVADAAKTAAYLDEAIPASDGTVAVCPCVDVTIATDLPARRFVNVYQAATGLAPGVFAAEGWDIASLLAGIAEGSPEAGRAAYLAGVDAVTGVLGPGGPIAFDAQGEPLGASREAHASEAAGRRWLPLG
jgi:ABC-type branched-subunit amino acid transport system substrate-binding protein